MTRSLTLLEPWHMLLRLVAPDDSATWPLQELGREVRFVVAPWCLHHKRWRDPTTCTRCLSSEVEVGVRVGPKEVRRVHPLGSTAVIAAITAVAGQLDAWIRRAWGAFGPLNLVGDRRAARILRDVQDVPYFREVFGFAGEGDRRFETWSFPEETGAVWGGLVARAYALNRVLARLGLGICDSIRVFAAHRAVEVARRFGEQGARLYPFVVGCLDAVVDCALVIQMRTVGSSFIARHVNTAGSGFLQAGQFLLCPQASGAAGLVSPDQALDWIASTVHSPTARTLSPPRLQADARWRKDRAGGSDFSDLVLHLPDTFEAAQGLLERAVHTSSPAVDVDPPAMVEAIRYTVEKTRKMSPAKTPYTFRVGSPNELRGPPGRMGKRT